MKFALAGCFAMLTAASACTVDSGGSAGRGGVDESSTSSIPASRDVRLAVWMKDNAVTALAANDPARLVGVFERIAADAPPGYATWAELSRRGAALARGGDAVAARAACQACHVEYRERYRADHR